LGLQVKWQTPVGVSTAQGNTFKPEGHVTRLISTELQEGGRSRRKSLYPPGQIRLISLGHLAPGAVFRTDKKNSLHDFSFKLT
jgi:hypothetical protein